MVFNSYTFAIFFVFVLSIYYAIHSWHIRKQLLLIASYIFYAAWNPAFVILLWFSTLADWQLSKSITDARQPSIKRLFLIGSLVINLGSLAFFKYGNFLLENLVMLLKTVGIDYNYPHPDIILPVGISFYTFQTLSYTLDVYFGRTEPWHSFLDYALYITFFPQLVAGPIVRADNFLQQCESKKMLALNNLTWGFSLITLGLFEKVVVADALLAPATESLYSVSGIPSFTAAWAGTLAFTGQIFCDFAGYSTCAIGTAICLFHVKGGRVIFVRMPVSQERWTIERQLTPPERYWKKFVNKINVESVHFADYPDLSNFKLPDTSHIDMRDKPAFTRILLIHLKDNLKSN
jgi:alginate O-acetyltransferase complex protein AlgI